jgi:hypothetical protein
VSLTEKSIISNASVPILDSVHGNVGAFSTNVWATARIAERVLTGAEIIPWSSPCGNCSYSFSFLGPAYQCEDLGPYSPTIINVTALAERDPNNKQQAPPEFNSSLFFYSLDDWGDTTTPVGLWVLLNSLNSTVHCTLHNATYTTNVSYLNNVQFVQNSLEYHNSITNVSTFIETLITSLSEGENVSDIESLQLVNYFQAHESISSVFLGWVAYFTGYHFIVSTSEVSVWPVANWTQIGNYSSGMATLTFPDNTASQIQDFMTNFTLSLLNLQTESNLVLHPIVETIVPATITSFPAVYNYSPVVLWQSYATALGASLICIILGHFMLFRNRVAGEMSFSQLLVTTRNPMLDKISEGQGLGGGYISDQVRKTKVKYGKLAGTEQVGFGLENEVIFLENNGD